MTDCYERLLRRFAPRNDGKEETRNDGKEGKAFCNKKNVTKKSLHFSKGLISNHKNFLKIFVKNSKNFLHLH
jgi:hypothetical protein